ncbi:hypothetical protein [Candidatus Odyssella thessalonicensis]|uniref:hypothetical protein n=1 Tax=Candidatus Odyssella thessalonicensis TaxID=84647 RepID=UPI000225A979|nr:hypothetical protein [Candidatus Odyssella thessalonicensis]
MRSFVRNSLVFSLGTVIIIGCTTTDEQVRRYEEKCLAYGFSYGSSDFSKCMLEQERMDRKEQLHQERMASQWHKQISYSVPLSSIS